MAGGIYLGCSELLVRSLHAGARDGRRRNCSVPVTVSRRSKGPVIPGAGFVTVP